MPPRNGTIMLLTVVVSAFCFAKAYWIRPAEPLADALGLIDQKYVKEVPQRTLVEAAMRGILKELDPYSEYFPPSNAELFQQEIAQSFPGIGILIDKPANQTRARVVSPLVNSPALRAGVLPGDLLWSVNGEDVDGYDTEKIRNLLRGPEGTSVNIQVKRPGVEALVDLTVVRAAIPIDSVVGFERNNDDTWSYRLPDHPRIAYIRVAMFGERTTTEVAEVLQKLDNDFDSLILDLRSNPGGLLSAAVEIADYFLDQGVIVETRERDNRIIEAREAEPGTLVDAKKKIVILLNKDSASASEVLSAALQVHQRAKVAGERSYGKGTIQELLPLESGRSLLKLTTARYYGPEGKVINRETDASEAEAWGVKPEPELEVKLDDAQIQQLQLEWGYAGFPRSMRDSIKLPAIPTTNTTDSDQPAEPLPPFEDTQLKKAIEYLSE